MVKRRGRFIPAVASPHEEILRVLREILAPLIRADGGEVYLLRADERGVELHLGGRYSGSPGNTLTTRRIIEPAIRAVAPSARITVTAGALVPKDARKLDPE